MMIVSKVSNFEASVMFFSSMFFVHGWYLAADQFLMRLEYSAKQVSGRAAQSVEVHTFSSQIGGRGSNTTLATWSPHSFF